MKQHVLTKPARCDLDELWEYIASENPAAADRVLAAIHQTIRRLPGVTAFGRAYDSSFPGIRRFPVPKHPYVAYFQGLGPQLRVLRIIHAHRMPPEECFPTVPEEE